MAVAAGVALVLDAVLDTDRFAEPRAARASRAATLWTVGAIAAAVLMLHDLGGYAGSLQRWEASVVYSFGHAFTSGQDAWSYAKERLVWNNGVLGLGNQSLFYGAPAYAFFHVADSRRGRSAFRRSSRCSRTSP
jgi:hypothetical protein